MYIYMYIHIHCKYIYIYQQPIFHRISTVKVSSNSALAPDIGVKRVAQGTYGTVFRGTLRDGTEVAIKARSRLDGKNGWVDC